MESKKDRGESPRYECPRKYKNIILCHGKFGQEYSFYDK
jgi:hypothetical protein